MSEMDRARWVRVKTILGDALEMPADDRAAYLKAACGEDVDLLAEVTELVGRGESGGKLDQVAASLRAIAEPGASLEPNDRLGRFRIVREIGRGGMGTVYLAEREGADFEQRVAIKVVAAGLSTPELSRRLRGEQRILARLDHPGIARFLDGDVAEDGRPYLVMEYVDGTPIDEYADEQRLPVAERLSLFSSVLDAVQYAHQHMVVHQDIKPSNILVRPDGTVKLLDFGVAGLLGEDADPAASTPGGHTPGYSSPEQTRGEPPTLASDVYPLGVLLHVLLTGARPAGNGTPPSRYDITQEAAERRRSTPSRLRARFRGDLDAIALRALEADPDDRYSNAEQVERDLQASAESRPVAARPDVWSYRAAKFFRRNRGGVTAVVAVLIALVLGLGATINQARRADRQTQLAAEERNLTEQVSDLLVGMFELSDPQAGLGETVAAREILDRALVDVDRTLAGRPAAQARLLYEIGRVYHNLGLYARATPVAERALDLYRRGDEGGDDLGRSLALVADLTSHAGDGGGAILLLEEALSIQRTRVPMSPLELARSLLALAQARLRLGHFEAAEPELAEALDLLNDSDPESLDLKLEVLYGLANVRHDDMDFAVVEARLAEAVALTPLDQGADVGRVGVVAALVRHDLAQIKMARGRHAEAETLFEEALTIQDRELPKGHPDRVATLIALAGLRVNAARHAEAVAMLEDALSLQEGAGDTEPLQMSGTRFMLGTALSAIGRDAEAVDLLSEALEEYERGYGADHPFLIAPALALSTARLAEGDVAGAEEAARVSRAAVQANYGADHLFAARSLTLDGRLAAASGASDSALVLLRDATARSLAAGGQDHRITIGAELALGELLLDLGRVSEAETLLETAFDAARALEEESSPLLSATEHGYGRALAAAGRNDQARARLSSALARREATLPPDHRLVRETRVALERLPSG